MLFETASLEQWSVSRDFAGYVTVLKQIPQPDKIIHADCQNWKPRMLFGKKYQTWQKTNTYN